MLTSAENLTIAKFLWDSLTLSQRERASVLAKDNVENILEYVAGDVREFLAAHLNADELRAWRNDRSAAADRRALARYFAPLLGCTIDMFNSLEQSNTPKALYVRTTREVSTLLARLNDIPEQPVASDLHGGSTSEGYITRLLSHFHRGKHPIAAAELQLRTRLERHGFHEITSALDRAYSEVMRTSEHEANADLGIDERTRAELDAGISSLARPDPAIAPIFALLAKPPSEDEAIAGVPDALVRIAACGIAERPVCHDMVAFCKTFHLARRALHVD